MEEKIHNITSKQLMAFTASSQIGFGVLFLPSTLAEVCGHDGWIATFLTGFLFMIALFILTIFLKRYRSKSILQINILLYGKYLGVIFNTLFILYLVLFTGLTSRLFTEVVKTTILGLTPSLVVSIALLIPTLYGVKKGLKVAGRFSSSLFLALTLMLIGFLLTYKRMRFTYILPVGEAGIVPITKGMLLAGFSFIGIELLTVTYPHVTDKEKATKYTVAAGGFTTFFTTSIVFFSTAFAGEEKLKLLAMPLYNLATSIKVPVIERVDLLFIILWFPIMGNVMRLYFFSAYHLLDNVFKFGDKKFPIFLVAVVVLFIGSIPEDLSVLQKWMRTVSSIGLGIIAFFFLSFLLSFIRKEGVFEK